MKVNFSEALDEIKKIACSGNVNVPLKKIRYTDNDESNVEGIRPVKIEASNWESESYATP